MGRIDEKLTNEMKALLAQANEIGKAAGYSHLTNVHVLLSIIDRTGLYIAWDIIFELRANTDELRKGLEAFNKPEQLNTAPVETLPLAHDLKRALVVAFKFAETKKAVMVDSGHLLTAICCARNDVTDFLARLGLTDLNVTLTSREVLLKRREREFGEVFDVLSVVTGVDKNDRTGVVRKALEMLGRPTPVKPL